MKMHHILLALPLAAAFGIGNTHASELHNGLASLTGNAVVGAWHFNVSIGPCADASVRHQFLALQTFNLGGTLSGTDTSPSSTRGGSEGMWSFNPRTRRYAAHMQFPRFVNDVYDGLQDVYMFNLKVSLDGQALTTDVRAYVLDAGNGIRAEVCGSATGERMHVDY